MFGSNARTRDDNLPVPRTLGPFRDCTSNQAIAFAELSKPKHAGLIEDSLKEALKLASRFRDIDYIELAVDIAMVKLALKILPHIHGHVHIQTNPNYSYSTEKTIANAFRIVQIFKYLDLGIETTRRVCIKIPSTWEGLMACRTLEMAGVRTLATTLFTFEQAALAAEVGCTYIAPYVNQLKVHFEPGFVDPQKLLPLCVSVQAYYEAIGARTAVLPASLTSTDEIFALAGAHHITISPGLLRQLSTPVSGPVTASLFDSELPYLEPKLISYVNDEAGYRGAFGRADNGAGVTKLTQAIIIFNSMQEKLIELFTAQQEMLFRK
ncbi:transaldolase family protein [Aspergillus mulundensis]|uniref:Transaldolase n=1 Tax=Aspergillus mulundensis TaxID=1810919 RepID=A0A3D8QJF8_9EURO|nr:Transaldolase [Aspergillus mulundensis]RDW61848.1 Transaldolase [Aspergillus mulundensis]